MGFRKTWMEDGTHPRIDMLAFGIVLFFFLDIFINFSGNDAWMLGSRVRGLVYLGG